MIKCFKANEEACSLVFKTEDYEKWSREEKQIRLKPYRDNRAKVICFCQKEGREMIISSTRNQDGERSYYLKRKPNTEKHHPNCLFYCEEGKSKDDDVSFLEVRRKSGNKGGKKKQKREALSSPSVKPYAEKHTFSFMSETLLLESIRFAKNTCWRKDETLTSDGLFSFLGSKINQYKKRDELAYRIMGEGYLSFPSIENVKKVTQQLNEKYESKYLVPYTMGRLEKIELPTKEGVSPCIYIKTVSKREFKFLINEAVLSELNNLSLDSLDSGKIWVAGSMVMNSKGYVNLENVEVFELNDSLDLVPREK